MERILASVILLLFGKQFLKNLILKFQQNKMHHVCEGHQTFTENSYQNI